MTVTYTAQVATSSFTCFMKLLARWRGSIYKLLWKDFILFAGLYYTLSFTYRFLLDDYYKKIFEMIVKYCELRNALIPVAFVLGFYVSLVMTRYWSQLGHIPWPDHMAMFVTANVHGLDERGRLMRRTMLRYVNLAYAITMSSISTSVKKRFPTFDHLVGAGLMTANEKRILDSLNTPHNKFFIPLAWTTSLVTRARKEGRIKDDFAVKTLIDEINQFRMHLATLFVYDMISMPLVYTQVVTIAVYTFFFACLMGRQFVDNDPNLPDVYFPVFTFLEYLFYMGWLKVAECFVNPFGEDDDDFDMNFLIDRNLQVSYLIVDDMHSDHPDLIRDQYWDDVVFDMPYTAASQQFKLKGARLGSAVDLTLSAKEKEIPLPLGTVGELEEVSDGGEQVDSGQPGSFSTRTSQLMSVGSYGAMPARRRSQIPGSRQTPESPLARSFPAPSFIVGSVDTVFPPSSPTRAPATGNNNNASPPSSPLSPVMEATQFPMDVEFEEAKESDRLLQSPPSPTVSSSIPREVFEMEAILARKPSANPARADLTHPKTDIQRPQQQLSDVEEHPESADAVGDHPASPKKHTPAGLVLVLPEAQRQHPVHLTSPLLFIDEDAIGREADETKDGGSDGQLPQSGNAPSLGQRIVAPPTLSPEIPTSPKVAIWVPQTKH